MFLGQRHIPGIGGKHSLSSRIIWSSNSMAPCNLHCEARQQMGVVKVRTLPRGAWALVAALASGALTRSKLPLQHSTSAAAFDKFKPSARSSLQCPPVVCQRLIANTWQLTKTWAIEPAFRRRTKPSESWRCALPPPSCHHCSHHPHLAWVALPADHI